MNLAARLPPIRSRRAPEPGHSPSNTRRWRCRPSRAILLFIDEIDGKLKVNCNFLQGRGYKGLDARIGDHPPSVVE